MKLDKKKLQRQKEIFQIWIKNSCKGTLEAVTGFGKTLCAVLAIKYFVKKDDNFICYVCVPTDNLRNQWREVCRIHGIADNVHVDTVHNLVKLSPIEVDMLVLDELHMFVGDKAEVFPTVFDVIKAERIFGLTATLGTDGIRTDIIEKYCPVINKVDLQEALREGYVSDYVQFNFGIELNNRDRIEYKKIDKDFYKYFSTFEYDFDLVKKCLDYNSDREEFEDPMAIEHANDLNWDHRAVMIHATNCMRKMRERKDFLYSASSKLDVAEQIIRSFSTKKILVFGQSTKVADLLSSRLPGIAESYHSNVNTWLVTKDTGEKIGEKAGKGKYRIYGDDTTYTWNQIKEKYDGSITRLGKKKVRDIIIERFRKGEIRVLCAATALDVGLDVPDIDMGIVVAATSKDRQNIQRTGRVIRIQEGKRAIIVQLYIKDTQDERWLDKRQTNDSNVKNITSITQIQT